MWETWKILFILEKVSSSEVISGDNPGDILTLTHCIMIDWAFVSLKYLKDAISRGEENKIGFLVSGLSRIQNKKKVSLHLLSLLYCSG